MSPLDQSIIKRKIALIETDLDQLKNVSEMSMAKFLDDFSIIAATERWLQRTAGRLIDINYHLLKEKASVTPKDYYHSFELMAKNGYISNDLYKKIAPITGLRNRLAHEYDEIDNQLLYESIHSTLGTVPIFLLEIDKLL
jgi:uncharacterized protein YutE (UPF0331/DUF86 family)